MRVGLENRFWVFPLTPVGAGHRRARNFKMARRHHPLVLPASWKKAECMAVASTMRAWNPSRPGGATGRGKVGWIENLLVAGHCHLPHAGRAPPTRVTRSGWWRKAAAVYRSVKIEKGPTRRRPFFHRTTAVVGPPRHVSQSPDGWRITWPFPARVWGFQRGPERPPGPPVSSRRPATVMKTWPLRA